MKIKCLKWNFFLGLMFFQTFLFSAEKARESFVRPGSQQANPEKATGSRQYTSAADRRSVFLSGAALDDYDINLDEAKKIATDLLEKKLPKNISDAIESFYKKIKEKIKKYGKVVECVANNNDDEINRIVARGIVLIFSTFNAKKSISEREKEILDGELTSCLMNITARLDYIQHQDSEVEKQYALFSDDYSKLKASYIATLTAVSLPEQAKKRAGSVSDIFTIKFKIIEARKAIAEGPSFLERIKKKITGDKVKEEFIWVSTEQYLL